MRNKISVCILLILVATAIFLLSCNSNSGTSAAKMASVQVSFSDPATCSAPQGPFRHIYVTVTDVRIHQSSNASPGDSGWVDLTPTLANNPVQIDLLGPANQCFLKMLGAAELQPGSYQQIRVILAANSATISGNQCGTNANCVTLTSDPTNTPHELQLSSESQTGIKVPPGKIAGGKFVVAAGDSKDLDLDFNACQSIVHEGNGEYRLKPVLRAGEIGLQNAMSGMVIDAGTQAPIVGGTTIVALEQNDGSGVDRVLMETVADANGNFSFCPLPAGTYDVVVVAINGAGIAYGATVITGVDSGGALGTVPITAALVPGSIMGTISTSTGTAGTAADISLSALQSITTNSGSVLVTIPLASQSQSTATVTTASGAACPANTDCVSYTLSLPAANPSVGMFSSSGHQSPGAPASGAADYTLDGLAFIPGMAGQVDCSPSELQTSHTSSNAALTVSSGMSSSAATLAFTGCQ